MLQDKNLHCIMQTVQVEKISRCRSFADGQVKAVLVCWKTFTVDPPAKLHVIKNVGHTLLVNDLNIKAYLSFSKTVCYSWKSLKVLAHEWHAPITSVSNPIFETVPMALSCNQMKHLEGFKCTQTLIWGSSPVVLELRICITTISSC